MFKSQQFRRDAVKSLTPQTGVYILADLDDVPIYVGKSKDGIRSRVRRHLTSARSDIIANRQIDVWEIAFVWEYPINDLIQMSEIEALLFHHYNGSSKLMNGSIPLLSNATDIIPVPAKKVQVLSDEEIADRQDVHQRLPRQADHYAQLVGHFLVVKNSDEIARAMTAHFERLEKYHRLMLGLATPEEG